MNLDLVDDGETLGHGVFDRNKAHKDHPPVSLFSRALQYGIGKMSTDRLDHADIDVLCVVHDEEALGRGSDRQFFGWYTFEASLVRSKGLDAMPTPSTDPRNEWHADVVMLAYSTEKQDQIIAFAAALNAEAKWRPKPLNRQAREDIEQTGPDSDS